jgi:formylglycine-generating enzyme
MPSCCLKGGTFDMGGNEYSDEQPIHKVTVSDFQLCKYPVTQAQWKQIMGENPSHFKGDDLPVEKVSWDDVQVFLEALNSLTNQAYRLPTEAEWEYAARGGSLSKGYKYAGSNDLSEVGWYNQNSGSKTHPVGQKKPNELGLYDVSGNVWEWCADWYADYPDSAQTNPTWATQGVYRVLRGGSWVDHLAHCRAAYRNTSGPAIRYYDIGFRLARTK